MSFVCPTSNRESLRPSHCLCSYVRIFSDLSPCLYPGHCVYNHPAAQGQERHRDANGHEQTKDVRSKEPVSDDLGSIRPLEDAALKKRLLQVSDRLSLIASRRKRLLTPRNVAGKKSRVTTVMVCIDTVSRSVLRAMFSMLMADLCPCSANIRLTCRLRSCNKFSYCNSGQLKPPPPTERVSCLRKVGLHIPVPFHSPVFCEGTQAGYAWFLSCG